MTDIKGKISLAGELGSGKSTVSAILTEKLGATYYSTGAIVRELAKRRGMTVVAFNSYMETHPEIDHEIDDGLKALSRDPRLLIIDSRMAWHFTQDTFKVYFTIDPEVAAARILGANRDGEHAMSLEATVADTRARRASERKHYHDQYGVDIKDLTQYDFLIDSTTATPEQVAAEILLAYENRPAGQVLLLSPARLWLPPVADDELYVEVCEQDGDFFVLHGVKTVLRAAEERLPFLSVSLSAKPVPAVPYHKAGALQ